MARVFSGVKPTGDVHLGNYIGAFRHFVTDQDEHDCIFCIVDLHAITVPQDPKELREASFDLACIYLAVGVDPARATLFVQSHVHEHSELAWVLGCISMDGELRRMTAYKDKVAKGEAVSLGVFAYPVLMAADILLYRTDRVPVGEDQRQHLELTRDIAQRFNRLFGETFKVPEAWIRDESRGARLMGLDDPTVKMSKSISAPNHAIYLLDTPDTIVKKFRRATTDSGREIRFDRARPGVFNLLTIYRAVTGQSEEEIERHFEGQGYGTLKQEVAEAVIDALAPLQKRFHELTDEPGLLDRVLQTGAEHAAAVANPTLEAAKRAVGLL